MNLPATDNKPSIQKEAYSIDDFAEAFSIGRTSVFKLIKTGQVRSARILGRTVILREELQRFAASLREVA